jgi:DNA-binding transcriptional LysR family regulator
MAGVADVEIRHLAALRAVAEAGTFSRAAERLGYSQAAVSQQIAGLEKAVATAVFDRPGGPRPVALTPAGRLLLEHAVQILDRLELAGAELSDLTSGTRGRLVIGTFQSVSVQLLPEVVGLLRTERPGLDIRLHERDVNDELIAELLAGSLDVAFLIGPVDEPDLTCQPIGSDPFVLVQSASEPGGSRPLPVTELIDRPMIGQHESSCQALVDSGLRASGVTPTYAFRTNDNGAVQAMVRAGMGPAVLPLLAVDPSDPGIRLRDLDPPLAPRQILLAHHARRALSPVVPRFLELTRQAWDGLNRSSRPTARRR